ncbi:succinate dehydrogenase/fumarate reductase iron-sulfur subunit [Chloroflexota bacterium]
MSDPTTITLRIQRFNPDVDAKPRLQNFAIAWQQGMTILDALQTVKAQHDGSVTFRRSCRHAICGSCAMNVNGKNMLVCDQPVKVHLNRKNMVTIRPLPYLPIIKDLVVDRTSFWNQYMRVKPWLIPLEEVPAAEFRMSPEEVAALQDAEKCIMCGACYSACSVIGMTKDYIGPHALLKAFLRTMDPRDAGVAERLELVAQDDGVFRCHTVFNCIDACPKDLNPTQAIETLRKLVQKRVAFEEAKNARHKTLDQPVPAK